MERRAVRLAAMAAILAAAGSSGVAGAAEPAHAEAGEQSRQQERQKELAARRADMAGQLRRLRELRVPDNIGEIRAKIKEIAERNKGRTGEGFMFRPREEDTVNVVENRMFSDEPSAFDCLTVFSRKLQERGIDLIVVPVPNNQMVYSMRLFKDLTPRHTVWPAYVEGMIKLLDNDVEVLDLSEPFRAYEGKGYVKHPFDHHWGSAGRQLAARLLAERLQRYGFVREAAPQRSRFTTETGTHWPPTSLVDQNKLTEAEKKQLRLPADEEVVRVRYTGGQPDGNSPILVIGDSNVIDRTDSVPGDSGVDRLLSREIGIVVETRGQHAGARTQAYRYSSLYAKLTPQPRVIIYCMCVGAMGNGKWPLETTKGMKPPDIDVYATVTKAPKLPDPKTATYKDALMMSECEVQEGMEKGKAILVVQWVMKDRKLVPAPISKVGSKPGLVLTSWEDAVAAEPRLGEVMMLNESDKLDAPTYWVAKCNGTYAKRDGNWTSTSTWNGEAVPDPATTNETIDLDDANAGHTVTFDPATNDPSGPQVYDYTVEHHLKRSTLNVRSGTLKASRAVSSFGGRLNISGGTYSVREVFNCRAAVHISGGTFEVAGATDFWDATNTQSDGLLKVGALKWRKPSGRSKGYQLSGGEVRVTAGTLKFFPDHPKYPNHFKFMADSTGVLKIRTTKDPKSFYAAMLGKEIVREDPNDDWVYGRETIDGDTYATLAVKASKQAK